MRGQIGDTRLRLRDALRGYAYLAPNFLGFLVFTALPVVAVAVMAFYSGSFATRIDPATHRLGVDARWCGLDNFARLADDLGFESDLDMGPLLAKLFSLALAASAIACGLWLGRTRPASVTPARHALGLGALVALAVFVLATFSRYVTFRRAVVDSVSLAGLVVSTILFVAMLVVARRRREDARALERAASLVFCAVALVAIAATFAGAFGHTIDQGGDLLRASWNTLVLLAAVPVQMAASLLLAMLLNRKIHGRVVYRTLLFLPSIASGIALFLVWRWLFNADFGLLNSIFGPLLDWLGNLLHWHALSRRTDWLGTRELAKPALILMGVWTAMGGTNMVLYLAGLQGIDPTLYEAAEIDGADAWSTFWNVTWPELRPTTFFILTTNLIGGFQIFDQVYIMTGGGPEGSTTTILYYIYTNMYVYEGRLGYAAAISIYLFAIVFVVTLVNYFGSRGGARAVRS